MHSLRGRTCEGLEEKSIIYWTIRWPWV